MSVFLFVLVWSVVVAAALLAGRAVANLAMVQGWKRAALMAWVGASLCSPLLWLAFTPARWHAAVYLSSPLSGVSNDGPKLAVAGTVSPPGARVVVIVGPETALGRWWVQDNVTVDSRSGKWSGVVWLGTDAEGREETFAVTSFATSEPWILQILGGRAVYPGEILMSAPPRAQSDVVLVRRTKR